MIKKHRLITISCVVILSIAFIVLILKERGISVWKIFSNNSVPAVNQVSDSEGIHKIKHVIIIMQENRSFDSYFGTFPGADGIPMKDGVPTVCVPDPENKTCLKPFHNPKDKNLGGPHKTNDAELAINGGKMDGFITLEEKDYKSFCSGKNKTYADCASHNTPPDTMGYHTDAEIPNYWKYAQEFVLHDHMFESAMSNSLVSHLFMVSAWSASCASTDPLSCISDIRHPETSSSTNRSWTDITYLLHKNNVSWGYYLGTGTQPDCEDGAMFCAPKTQNAHVNSDWNPLPSFNTVKENDQVGNVQDIDHFFTAVKDGTLPNVVWIAPNDDDSEHPPHLVSDGQAYTTSIINSVMQSPEWKDSAIFLAWDDWGGFYDHMVPPSVDENGYGLRVPSLVISPYAKKGYIDHQVISFDAYLKFIEDDFLNGARIDPVVDGRPDSRPTVRENVPTLGDLALDFDFSQQPRQPIILSPHPNVNFFTQFFEWIHTLLSKFKGFIFNW